PVRHTPFPLALYTLSLHDALPISLEIRKELLNGKNLDLLVVCAPCQPFSSQGEKDSADGRARLILSAVRFAEVLKPKLILFENRSEEHTSELQSRENLVCRLLLEK